MEDRNCPKSFFLGSVPSVSSTHGLPLDFIQDAARDAGIEFDLVGFEWALSAEQSARARASWKGAAKQTANPCLPATSEIRIRGLPIRLARRTARFSPSSTVAKARSNSRPVRKAKSSSITRRSTPSQADRSAIADGSTSDDHNTVVAEVKGCYSRFKACARTGRSPSSQSGSATKSMPSSTPKSASPPCATTRPRICFRPDCAKFWAST